MNVEDNFREELIRAGGIISYDIFSIEGEISKLRFYFKTMESFIEKEEAEEAKRFEEYTRNLNDRQKSSFWERNDPTPWDDIFLNTLRSSFLIVIVSYAETILKTICRDVGIILRTTIKCNDLKGNIFERSRKFLDCFGKFIKPTDKVWELINNIYYVRNVFVHNDGFMDDSGRSRLTQFIKESPDIYETNDSIKIGADFCYFALESISSFLLVLRSEVQELCKRVEI